MKAIFVLCTLLFSAALAAPSTRTLEDDFEDFYDLLPVDEMKTIAQKYLNSDVEFQAVITYLQGDEWAALVAEVGANPTVKEFKEYLNNAGVDIDAIIKWIHDLIAGAKPEGVVAQRGVKDFLEEIKETLPVADLAALLINKLQNSDDFKDFYATVSSEKSHGLVEEVRALPEVQRLAARLLEMGIDLKPVLDFIYELFGWN